MDRNNNIDILRAVGALLVFSIHCRHLLHYGFGWGWIGVPLFFAVSGYLICGRLLDLADRGLPLKQALVSFYWRRAVRIFPVYWLFLLVVTAVAVPFAAPAVLKTLPYAWTYTTNFFNASADYIYDPILGPTWSLAVEEQFYLLFPFVVLLLGRSRLLMALIVMILAAPLLRFGVSLAIDLWPDVLCIDKPHTVYMLGFTQVDAFAFGALVNLLPRHWCQRLGSARCIVPTILATMAISGLATGRIEGALFMGLLTEDGGHLIWGYTLLNIVSMMLVCWAVSRVGARESGKVPLLARFGHWSYSFYLIQFPIIVVVGAVPPALGLYLPGWLGVVVAFALTTFMARLLYEAVEKPMQGLRGLFDRPTRTAQVAS